MYRRLGVNIARAGLLAVSVALCLLECGGIVTYRDTLIRQIPPWVILSRAEETATIHADVGDEAISVNLNLAASSKWL